MISVSKFGAVTRLVYTIYITNREAQNKRIQYKNVAFLGNVKHDL